MKTLVFIFTLLFSTTLMAGSHEFKLTSPEKSVGLQYEDSIISVSFLVHDSSIEFKLFNKTAKSVLIDWDKCAWIRYNESKRIITGTTPFINKDLPQTPTIVAPETYISESIIPVYKIYRVNNEWDVLPLIFGSGKNEEMELMLILDGKEYRFIFNT